MKEKLKGIVIGMVLMGLVYSYPAMAAFGLENSFLNILHIIWPGHTITSSEKLYIISGEYFISLFQLLS